MPAGLVIVPMLALFAVALLNPDLGAFTVAVSALAAAVLTTLGIAALLPADAVILEAASKHLCEYLSHRRLPPQVSDRSARDAGTTGDGLLRDVSELCAALEHQRRALERLAMQDPLTGINNRRGGEVLLVQTGHTLASEPGPLAVAVVDVDNLRELNAVGGHARGDAALRRLAQELEGVLGVDDWVARWGGDEFLVVGHCSAADMVSLMEQARRALAANPDSHDDVRVSVGVAGLQPTESPADCIVRADDALYAAKGQGRDKVRAAA
ncbi:MAG: GGDEF domain-containing protein [Geodermatophilaceae bacterium]|nr:GGDEF domain-containing protein [Geodermatophilaceae bacterium]